ncbi:pyruvate formate lyase family protein, partial [Rubrivivax sp. JA1055]
MNTMTIVSSRANPWEGFAGGRWETAVDVRDFIQKNYTPYAGTSAFLEGPTTRTLALWKKLSELLKQEQAKGVLDVSTDRPSTIVAHDAGYIDQGLELIVGLQTDAPLKRAIMPNGGLRMVQSGLKAYGFESDPTVDEIWTKYRKSHNQGVFDVYSTEISKARKSAILTGLPDAYGRGRIIGDYRRVALYGVDALRKFKQQEYKDLDSRDFSEDVLRLREELSEQGRALEELKVMGAKYGFDLGRPAQNAREAVQWTYLAYLAAVKEQNGAAMSLGRVSSFLDIYIQRDLDAGLIDEARAQEFIDDLVVKLRIVRFLRTPEYDQLFSGDPTWVTEAI